MTFDPCGHETPDADLDALAELVRSLAAPLHHPVCLEVGSWSGSSALAMIRGGAKAVHCVDTWQGTAAVEGPAVFKAFCQNVGDLIDLMIFPHKGASRALAAQWSEQLDLVFIDADHSYEECLADILAWTPHVRPSGIVCGHDFTMPGVARAVIETGPHERCGWSMWWRKV